jgi:hypothetical protein
MEFVPNAYINHLMDQQSKEITEKVTKKVTENVTKKVTQEVQLKIALNMLNDGFSVEKVAKLSKLSKKVVNSIDKDRKNTQKKP